MKITIEVSSIEELIELKQQLPLLESSVVSAPGSTSTGAEASSSTTTRKKKTRKKTSKKDEEGNPTKGRPSQAEIDADQGAGTYDAQQDEKQLREQAISALQDLNVKKGVESCRHLLTKFGATRVSEVKVEDIPKFVKNCQDQVAQVGA